MSAAEDVDQEQVVELEAEKGSPTPAVVDRPSVPAFDLPRTPEGSELMVMAQLASTFAYAKLVPEALQGSPADCLLVMMTARSLGFDYMTGFRELFVIDGKVSMSEKSKLALVHHSGIATCWPDPDNDAHSATWYGRRYDQPEILYQWTFSDVDAERVEARERGKSMTLAEKSNHRQYPKAMKSWRALGFLLDVLAPEVATGMYSPDALGAITDEEGRPIEIREVEPLVQSERDKRRTEARAADEGLAPEDERRALFDRIQVLPEAMRDELRAKWREAELPAVMNLPAGKMRKTKAMVAGFEAKARSQGWEPPPSDAPQGAESTEGTSTPTEAVEAQETQPQPPQAEAETEAPDPNQPGVGGQEAPLPFRDEWPDYPEDPDEQRRLVADEVGYYVGRARERVPNGNQVVDKTVDEIRGLHHRRVNAELALHGVPHEVIEILHIDARRMLLTAAKLKQAADEAPF